jgi:hypothetical protein
VGGSRKYYFKASGQLDLHGHRALRFFRTHVLRQKNNVRVWVVPLWYWFDGAALFCPLPNTADEDGFIACIRE